MSLDRLLDSVADAVSAMVIFSNDAGSNSAVLRNLKTGSEAVRTAVSGFVQEARETVDLWNELGSVSCASQMDQACDGLMGAINDIVTACGDIVKDPHDNAAKANLLESGKDVMKYMVAVLQFNDLYGVMVLLNRITIAQGLVDVALEDSFNADDFSELVRILLQGIDGRIDVTHEIKVKQALEESKPDLEKYGIGLATIVNRSAQDPRLREKIPVIATPLQQAFQKAIKAIKLSAKSPFDLKMLDTEFQYHDDEFIDEITVTTSDFHASLNAIKKSVKSGDEFELERAIRAIEADLKAEIVAAEELAEETSDPQLRAQMMAKIKQAKAEMGNLMEKMQAGAAQALLSGDYTDMEPLLEGAFKMFGGLFHETGLKEIIMAGESLDALFGDLLVAIDTGDKSEAVALTKDIAREIERQGIYANSFADLITDDDFRKQRILGAYQQLAALCGTVAQLTNDALEGVPGARVKLGELVSQAHDLETELLLAVSNTTEEELLEGGIKITQALKSLGNLIDLPKLNKELITSGLTDLLSKMKHQTNMATSWASTLNENPGLAERITGNAQKLRSSAVPLAISVKKVLAAENEDQLNQAKKEFRDASEKFGDFSDALVSNVIQSPDSELEGLQGKLGVDLQRLQDAIASQDLKAMAAAVAELKKNSRGMHYVAQVLSGDLDDPDLQRMLLEASNNLVGKLDKLLDVSKNAFRQPKNKDARNELDNLLKDFEANLDQLIHFSDSASPEDQMTANAGSIIKLARKYARDVETANSGQAKTFELLEKRIEKQKQLAAVVAKRCDYDLALGEKLVAETAKLDKNLLAIKATVQGHSKPDKKVIASLQNAVNQLVEQSNLTGTLAQDVKTAKKEAEKRKKEEEERLKEEARLEEERQKQIAAEKQRLVEVAVPVGIKEVWLDAQELKSLIEETKLLEDKTPVGSLVGLADQLARAMQELASLSKGGTKNQIIQSARQIASMVDQIEKYISEVSKTCRDPIINREMADMGHVAKNFSVQLKILCGVKAGLLLEDDKDTAQSLILCAKGLCKAVGDVVNRAQIAKLKPIGGAPKVIVGLGGKPGGSAANKPTPAATTTGTGPKAPAGWRKK